MEIDDILQEFDAGAQATPQQDVEELTKYWIAERSTPEILPFQEALLARLMERIRQQIELVENETGNLDPTSNFRLILIQTELERVKYLVRAYLRIRMHKIDKYAVYILENADVRALLSESEEKYMKAHLAVMNNHYHASFLRSFPDHLRKINEPDMVEKPDMDSAVFCRVVRDPEGDATVRIPGTDAEFTLSKGDVYVVRYSAVREFIGKGDVELI